MHIEGIFIEQTKQKAHQSSLGHVQSKKFKLAKSSGFINALDKTLKNKIPLINMFGGMPVKCVICTMYTNCYSKTDILKCSTL